MEPCYFHVNPQFKPRYPRLDIGDAFPNWCLPCTSDKGNWECWAYRDYITDLLIKAHIRAYNQDIEENNDGVIIEIPGFNIPDRYKEPILRALKEEIDKYNDGYKQTTLRAVKEETTPMFKRA